MGKTLYSDLPGEEQQIVFDLPSAATNAAATTVWGFEAPADIVITGITYTPTAADGIGHATTYRTFTLRDGGTAASGTTAIGTWTTTATKPSLVPVDFTVTAANASIDAGDVVLLYHVANTTAGTHTEVKAGVISVQYRLQ